MDTKNMQKLINALVDMYYSQENKLSFAIENPEYWQQIQYLRTQIAIRNAITQEHPIDSMIAILQFPETVYNGMIVDTSLERFITNVLIVSLIQIGIMQQNGYTYDEAIYDCHNRGFFAWMSSHGRHAASDDYPDIIQILQSLNLWSE